MEILLNLYSNLFVKSEDWKVEFSIFTQKVKKNKKCRNHFSSKNRKTGS